MAWLRLPRSLRAYLLLGLVVTVAIVTFSTSRIGETGATDPRPMFQFFTSSNLAQNQHNRISSTSSGPGFSGNDSGGLDANTALMQSSSVFNGTSTEQSYHHDLNDAQNKANLDFHTTSAGGSTSSGSLSSSLSSSLPLSPSSTSLTYTRNPDSSFKAETFSDTIIISPLPTTTSIQRSTTKSDAVATAENKPNLKSLSRLSAVDQQDKSKNLLYFPPFNSSSNPNARSMRELDSRSIEQAEYRRNYVKGMMKYAWQGYADFAWGYNEVKPVTKAPHTESIFGGEKMGASIVDGIDTLYIMGLKDEYLAARTWIETNLDFNKFDLDLSVFETNIRYVGGLLSIYALTQDQMFLDKAVQVADKLLPAFDTPSGIPYSNVNLRTGYARNHDWAYGAAILSEFGSFHLEFVYLSYLTGDPKYREKVLKIREAIKKAVPRSDGLYNNYMNTDTGQWLTRPTHISMGALGDSFYEYLLKAYVQSDGQDVEAYQMYIEAIKAYENKLIFTSTQSRLVYFAELKDTSINHKMDSLACFSGGMLAMGATKSEEPIKSRHMTLASGITNTCHESCIKSKSHLGPETFLFSNRADALAYAPNEKYYILRPEILESYFYMWRYTHDPKYRDWAWDFIEALERYCRSEAGYSGLRNVYQPVIKDDVQQSFFLAEVLKYLYLIFTDDNIVNLNDWVFNTEAHPMPILKRSF